MSFKNYCTYMGILYFLNLRDRACAQVGEGQRKRERERIPSRLHIASTEPNVGLELMKHEIMT